MTRLKLFYRIDNYAGGAGQPYYAYQGNVSSDLALSMVGTVALTMRMLNEGLYAAQTKNLGSIIGRGWTIISIYNATDSTATTDVYILLLIIRPDTVHLANSNLSGIIRRTKDTMT